MKFIRSLALFCVLFIVCSGGSPVICAEKGCCEFVRRHPSAAERETGSNENVGARLASVFRDYISRVDGDRCPSLPTCSSYSVQAFKKHGFFIGWLMTVDRLIHEGNEGSVSPIVYYNGKFRIIDPVENNDFWWFHKNASTEK